MLLMFKLKFTAKTNDIYLMDENAHFFFFVDAFKG